MSEAWIIDAARTPRGVGKQGKGALWEVHPQKLLSTVLKALVERDLNTDEIDDVIMSCSTQFRSKALALRAWQRWTPAFLLRPLGSPLTVFAVAASPR